MRPVLSKVNDISPHKLIFCGLFIQVNHFSHEDCKRLTQKCLALLREQDELTSHVLFLLVLSFSSFIYFSFIYYISSSSLFYINSLLCVCSGNYFFISIVLIYIYCYLWFYCSVPDILKILLCVNIFVSI